MRKVLVVMGTRPEAIKLAPVVRALQTDARFKVVTCISGQHRDMVRPICELFGVLIDHDLDVMTAGQSLDSLTARIVEALPPVFSAEQPDLVVVQGDTTTAFAAALSAFYHKVPVAHVEAGLRTHDLSSPWPEEGNRAMISRLATHHFAPTEAALRNLVHERAPGRITVTGNTVVDAARLAANQMRGARELQIAARLGLAKNRRTILFTMHRRESFGEPAKQVFTALAALAEQHDVDVLFPVHPNPAIRIPAEQILGSCPRIRLVNPLGYDEIICALQRCHLLLTDSGGLAEEAPTFSLPALVLRESTERPECVESGNARLVGHNVALLNSLVGELLKGGSLYQSMASAPNPFGDGHAAMRILDALDEIPMALEIAA